MLIFKLVQTEKKIKEYQQAMYELANVRGLNDPHVLSISQKLDKEILFFQNFSINIPKIIRDDAFAKYASGGKYVNGITSYDGKERNLELTEVEVPEAGHYKLVVQYANEEYSGSHSYNNNVVERYAQISVNGGEPETVYFKNTISWQQFATVTIDVNLKKGKNSIKFYNNNTYNGGANPYGGSNASGTAAFIDTVMVPKQYKPAFDKFEIYGQPFVVDKKEK